MSPTRAKSSALGTNPLTLAAPGKDGDSFVLDMATTAVALGKVQFSINNIIIPIEKINKKLRFPCKEFDKADLIFNMNRPSNVLIIYQ